MRLQGALPPSGPRLTRRRLLAGALSLAALGLAAPVRRAPARPRFAADPFSLGVAAGDPRPDGFVLWTRLAPDPLNGGGMAEAPVEVAWEVAADDGFRRVVRSGVELARPDFAHSVHVEAEGLEPGRTWFYRFRAGDAVSPAGRARTAPAPGAALPRLRFGLAGCQNWEEGFYTAWRHVAAEELDFVFHYGDYIYEYGAREPDHPAARRHNSEEVYTLAEYRNRYALYKSDPDLQAAHAAHAFLPSFDDHEVDNNWAGEIDEKAMPADLFLERRAAAFRAWYEHMPVRRAARPDGASVLMHRRFGFGDLASVWVLDTRQYRTDQPCHDGVKPRCPAALDPAATMLGPAQERWLYEGLARSAARWNVIAQQVAVMQRDLDPAVDARRYAMDKWDGYAAARGRLLGRFAGVANPVVLSGDLHNHWAGDLKADFDDPASPTLGAEFIGSSISSNGDGADSYPETEAVLRRNPHVKFFSDRRGYVVLDATPARLEADFRTLPYVSRPGAPVATRARFVVEAGRPGAQPA